MAKSVKKRKYTRRAATAERGMTTISLPKKLVAKANELLKERGTDIETYLRLTASAFVNTFRPLELSDIMDFGQYKDSATVEEACRVNPKYIAWLIAVSSRVKFAPEVLELVEELLPGGIDHEVEKASIPKANNVLVVDSLTGLADTFFDRHPTGK